MILAGTNSAWRANCYARILLVVGVLTLLMAFGTALPASVAETGQPTEADITRATGNLLEHSHFSQLLLDDQICGKCLDLFQDTLDGEHQLFLQSDRDQFATFRPGLADKIMIGGETGPAHAIYTRYLKRLAQQADFVAQLLQEDSFDFTGHDSWQIDRHDAAPPSDLAAAQALWRAELREEYLTEKLAGTATTNIVPTLARRYGHRLQTMSRLGSDEVMGLYLDALARAFDPHSDYLGHPERENFNIEMNMSLFGIGGSLEVKRGLCFISDLVPGGPAASSRLLKIGDRIVAVAQDGGEPVDIMGMTSSQVVELIRGPKGSTVRLTIIPADEDDSSRKTVTLVRDEIKLADEYTKAAIVDLPQTGTNVLRVGIIELPLFYGKREDEAAGAAADTARLIGKFQQEGVRGLILDLRRNGGGSTEEAIRLTGLFIPSGPVLQILTPEREVKIGISPEDKALYDGPLVVLTSRLSASASEIVAGALQDYGRALIVGDSSTFGKGTMQDIVPLRDIFHQRGLGEVHLTIGKFYRPSGASTQLKGVVPDIILPSETDLPDFGESNFPNALPWDVLPPATYAQAKMIRPVVLTDLRKKSAARVQAEPGFRLMREKLAIMEKNAEAKSISLNEANRRREKLQADGIEAQMNKVILAKAPQMPPTYFITLDEIDSPLPRKPAQTGVAQPGVTNPDDGIELSEAEHILADYILALRAPLGSPARKPTNHH